MKTGLSILSLLLVSHLAASASTEVVVDSLSVTLDEVNITAVKQMNHLHEAAEAATILSGGELNAIGAVSVKGISDVVPNFFMPDYGSRITSTIYVRGIGARMDQPSVGLNVDNVPYINKDAYDFDISDIASVEMLRGPQSTMYGRNTMAGLINITTLSPMRFQGWKIKGEIGNGFKRRLSAGWYHKFSDSLGLSVVGDYSGHDGFFTNEYNGKKLDGENNFSGRVKLQWIGSDGWTAVNTASFGVLRQGGYPYEYKETWKIEYNDTCFYRRFTFANGLTVRKSTDKFNFVSVTSVQHITDNMTLDQDFLPLNYFTLTQKKHETALTEDFLVKNADTGERYNWLTGVFGFYKHLNMSAPVTFLDKGISELIESHRNESNPTYPIKWDSRAFTLNSDFTVPTWGVAIYHQSDLKLDNWLLSAALRFDYERSTLNYHSFCFTGYTIFHEQDGKDEVYRYVPIDIDDDGRLSKDFLTVLPKVSVSYLFPSGIGNLYAKFSRGYKAGGFNTQMFSDVLQQRLMGIMGIGAQYNVDDIVSYKPEQSWNYELGGHFDLFEGKMTLDWAAFYIDCRDQQLTMFPDGTTTGRIMTNAGKTNSFGGEVSAAFALTENVILNGSYGYTNAKFREFFNGINDFKGKFLPYAPRHTLFLQALWATPVKWWNNGSFELDVNLRGTGKIYWNESNSEWQRSYALLGASATFGFGDLSLQLWGKNLTDTKYKTFYFLSMGNEFFQRGRGVEFGATLRLSL
ncbi:MAG: TonB-dependent receptor [Bacteroides sp.]|nr:TonB-dependent receptor [Bacteroides sp.]